MTRDEMIEALKQIKEAIACSNELTEGARFYAHIAVEDAIDHICENWDED